MSSDNILIVANSDHSADMLYAVGMFVPEPFIYLRLRGRCYVVLDDFDTTRARERAPHCRAIPLSRCYAQLQKEGRKKFGLADVVHLVLRNNRVKKVHVPAAFPLGLARDLERLGIRVKAASGPLFPAREFKTAAEIKKISAALIMAEVGLAEGIQALKSSRVGKNRKLIYHNVPLTSEKLRAIIGTAIMQAGGIASHTVVAGGRHAANPHEQGHGLLRANEPIIIDIFPRSQKTGYFGDITRTVVKGRASEPLRKLYKTVERGQELGFEQLRPKAGGRLVYDTIHDYFQGQGYRTMRGDGRMRGFCHGAGHGLGLELRESPSLTPQSKDALAVGHVVTLEPGLYYPEIGGVRLEDVALVTRNGPRNLTKFEKILEV